MPYITQERRKSLDEGVKWLVDMLKAMGTKEGDLNYVITSILAESYSIGSDPSYGKVNSAVGVLECAKLELYRRIAGPYENSKIPPNGDIPEYGKMDRLAE